MARLRYRYLLPLGHLLVDVIVLSHFIWQGYEWQRDACGMPSAVRAVPSSQEGKVGWDVYSGPPMDLAFLAVGTPPAGLISCAARPGALIQDCNRVWDPVWFAIHVVIALLFWLLVGAWQDSPTARFRKLMGVYLAIRLAFSPLCWRWDVALMGTRVEVLFWLAFTVFALVQGCLWLLRRLRART
jgi:hypothetical protein